MDNDDDGHDDDEDDDDADDAHVGGTDALSWELMLSLRTENKQQRPHHDDDNDHHDHQTIQLFTFRKYLYALKIIVISPLQFHAKDQLRPKHGHWVRRVETFYFAHRRSH